MRTLSLVVAAGIVAVAASHPSPRRGSASTTWTLVEDLRIGGADAGPKSFNEVRGIVATKSGNIFVLDYKTTEIRVFDSHGTFLRLAARKGQGPGEILMANGLAIGQDDIVWVNDASNRRYSQFSADGHFIKQLSVPISQITYIWEGAIDAKGQALDPLISVRGAKLDPVSGRVLSEQRSRIIHADGTADTVAYPSCPGDVPLPNPASMRFNRADGAITIVGLPFLARQQIAVTRSGTVWCTPSSEYRLFVGPLGGALKEVVHLTVPPVPVSAEERKHGLDRIDSLVSVGWKMESGDPSLTPHVKPQISKLYADDMSRVWVRRAPWPDPEQAFDVFDATGTQVARVTTKGTAGPSVWIAGNYLYTTVTGDDDAPIVVRYKIVK
jgi:hypothetical protein